MLEVADKNPGDTYAADEWNEVAGLEMRNLVQNSGQTFNAADNTQLLKGFGVLATRSMDYVDSGSANAYVLNAINSYAQLTSFTTGTMVRFFAIGSNTGPSTVTVNGQGPFNILDYTGAPLVGGEIVIGQYITLIDIGGAFRIYNFNDEDFSLLAQLEATTPESEGTRLIGGTNQLQYNYCTKAYGCVSESGGVYALENGYNIDNVTKNGTGYVTITFTEPFKSVNYSTFVNPRNTTSVNYFSSLTVNKSSVIIFAKAPNGLFIESPFSFEVREAS